MEIPHDTTNPLSLVLHYGDYGLNKYGRGCEPESFTNSSCSPVLKPGRRSIRLPGYDYASAGWYFVTICCKDRAPLFGEIRDGEMVLNEAGVLVEKW